MKKIFLLLILVITFISLGCEYNKDENNLNYYLDNIEIPQDYTVELKWDFAGSGGERRYDGTHMIIDSKSYTCTGEFTHRAMGKTNKRNCTIDSFDYYVENITKIIKNSYTTNTIRTNISERICFSNIKGGEPYSKLVCFNDQNQLVNYGGFGGYGGLFLSWNVEGYYLTEEKIRELI